jgi:hypothetical protein
MFFTFGILGGSLQLQAVGRGIAVKAVSCGAFLSGLDFH